MKEYSRLHVIVTVQIITDDSSRWTTLTLNFKYVKALFLSKRHYTFCEQTYLSMSIERLRMVMILYLLPMSQWLKIGNIPKREAATFVEIVLSVPFNYKTNLGTVLYEEIKYHN